MTIFDDLIGEPFVGGLLFIKISILLIQKDIKRLLKLLL